MYVRADHATQLPTYLSYNLQMDILGGASLNMDGANMNLTAHQVEGDKTGRVTLRKSQTYENTESRIQQKFGILSQRESDVNLPPEMNCRGIDMYIKGRIFV